MTDYEAIEYEIFNGVVAFMVGLAFVFIGVCILIFCLSRSRTKKFLQQRTQETYRKARGMYTASIVFTVFITLFALSGIAGFFTVIFELLDGADPDMVVWDIVEIVEFVLAVTAMVLGITALTSFGKAKAVYIQLFPPQPVYYNNSNVQGWQYGQHTYYQYPQQGNQQYGQPYSQQPNYPQNPHQAYQQPDGAGKIYTQSTVYGTPDPTAPREKMCPSCGVVNDGKNQFCVFCGKPL